MALTNTEALDLMRKGYQVGVASPFTVANSATMFHKSLDFGLRSGNVALKHPRCFAFWYEANGAFQRAEDDPTFQELLGYAADTQVIRAGRWLQVPFRLSNMDELFEGQQPGRRDLVKILRYWHVPGYTFLFDYGMQTSVNVGPHDEPQEMPAKLRAAMFDERRLWNPNGR